MTIVRTATCNIISPNPAVLTVRTLRFYLFIRFPVKRKKKERVSERRKCNFMATSSLSCYTVQAKYKI